MKWKNVQPGDRVTLKPHRNQRGSVLGKVGAYDDGRKVIVCWDDGSVWRYRASDLRRVRNVR